MLRDLRFIADTSIQTGLLIPRISKELYGAFFNELIRLLIHSVFFPLLRMRRVLWLAKLFVCILFILITHVSKDDEQKR